MRKLYRVYQVDSFTKNKFAGNPAGVVPNADGLTEPQMQMIARELNNSETAFLFSPTASDHEVWVRFFTPTVEVPSCGHATVAAHYVRALEMSLPSSTVMQKIGIGVLPVDIEKKNGDYEIFMTQRKPEFLDILQSKEVDALLNGLGVCPAETDDRAPVQIVSTGHSKVLMGLQSVDKLLALKPDFTALRNLSERIGCSGYYVFALQDVAGRLAVAKARMFAPAIGINEDPVNGNGSGQLGAHLVKYGLANHDDRIFELKSIMGEALGRPGTVHISVTIENGEPVQVKVGGEAVLAFKTEIEIS